MNRGTWGHELSNYEPKNGELLNCEPTNREPLNCESLNCKSSFSESVSCDANLNARSVFDGNAGDGDTAGSDTVGSDTVAVIQEILFMPQNSPSAYGDPGIGKAHWNFHHEERKWAL